MSDVSQGEGWWVASDGKWYPPHLHPEYRPATPSESPVVQGATRSDAADEPSMEPSAIAVATAQQCVNGHDMPESQVFCSVCGSGRSEVPLDFSAPVPDKPQGWVWRHLFVVLAAVVVLVAVGLSVGLSGGGGSASSTHSSTPSKPSTPAPVLTPAQHQYINDLDGASVNEPYTFRAKYNTGAWISNQTLLTLGNDVCTAYASDNGSDPLSASQPPVSATVTNGLGLNGAGGYDSNGEPNNAAFAAVDEVGYLEGAAIIDLCPQYIPVVQQSAGSGEVEAGFGTAQGYSSVDAALLNGWDIIT